MSDDLARVVKAFDGPWEVESVKREPDGTDTVTYRSLDVPGVRWSHTPFGGPPYLPVGTRVRMGFARCRD